MKDYTRAKEKLAAIFNQAPWLKTDGKAVHLPVSGLGEGHQLTWPELYALYHESDKFVAAPAIVDTDIEARRLYNADCDNHPTIHSTIHSNRFAAWSELDEAAKAVWRIRAYG